MARLGGLLIGRVASRPDAAVTTIDDRKQGGAGQVMTARDQHQPASSRAIAVLATVCFFFRAV